MNQKGFTLIFIVLLIFLAIGGLSLYNINNLHKNSKTNDSLLDKASKHSSNLKPSAITQQEVDSWTVFDNQLAFHSLKHPNDWKFLVDKPLSTTFESKSLPSPLPKGQRADLYYSHLNGRVYGTFTTVEGVPSIFCPEQGYPTRDCENPKEEQFFDKNHWYWQTGEKSGGGGSGGSVVEEVYETKIDGKRAMVRVSYPIRDYEGIATYQGAKEIYIWIGKPNFWIFTILVNYDRDNTKVEELQTFDKILSTLKITPSQD